MKLTTDWWAVLKHAWSVKFIALSILLSGLEAGMPFLGGLLPVAPGTFALLCIASTIAAGVARIVAQKKLSGAEDPPAWETGEAK